ncbi:G-protein coupled receptor GRL101-like [Littorina saxatilis]|uniref:G-protein coupled receptor GRL101-like n=1 Tax=Littorina saxatilis TaxID=31220 RepID=UPI0038B6A18D
MLLSLQCVHREKVCDGQVDCHNQVDEDLCSTSMGRSYVSPSPPAVVELLRSGEFIITKMNNSQPGPLGSAPCPETHFQCPGDGYCMPGYLRCNGVSDCLGEEDEADCNTYTCPGHYRCRGSISCLHPHYLCDGIYHCPQHDDELLCDLDCPEGCTCYGQAFFCRRPFPARSFPRIRYLDGRASGIRILDLEENTLLIHLNLAENWLTSAEGPTFPNLRRLDLSDNKIKGFYVYDLGRLPQLETLVLSGNPLVHLFESGKRHAVILNLSGSEVDSIIGDGFKALTLLHTLDIRGCPLTHFPPDMFSGLQNLQTVYSDNFKLCCPALLPIGFNLQNCFAPTDEISSCESLLRSNVYRIFLSIFAAMALLGNSASFIYRVFLQKKKRLLSFDVFVAHLCVGDFLMGVYLMVIGVADRLYQGTYLWEDNTWKSSAACKMAGFLSLMSSEVSAMVIVLITVDRFLVLRFPFSRLHFDSRSAQIACFGVWAVGFIVAAAPLVPVLEHWKFYGQSGICIPLPVTRSDFPGHTYAFGVMIIANFALFIIIAAGQIVIYWSIHSNSMSSSETTRKSHDITIARRLITVAMSDFLCWFPIGLLGLLAATGTPIPGEVNVAMAIFVLPFNSALNPFLYTLNLVLEKRRKAEEERIKKRLMSQFKSMVSDDKTMSTQFNH